MQLSGANPRLNQLCARWQQVWLLALDRQRKLNDALDRLEEVRVCSRSASLVTRLGRVQTDQNQNLLFCGTQLKEFANFDFDVWRKKYMRWMNHKKSRVMDFFRRIDKDQDGKITRQEFIDGILASSESPSGSLCCSVGEMTKVANERNHTCDASMQNFPPASWR